MLVPRQYCVQILIVQILTKSVKILEVPSADTHNDGHTYSGLSTDTHDSTLYKYSEYECKHKTLFIKGNVLKSCSTPENTSD